MAQPTRSELEQAQERALELGPYWSLPPDQLLRLLTTTSAGLSSVEATQRLDRFGRNALREDRLSWLVVLAGQLKSPLVLLLVFAALASALTGEWVDAAVVLGIVLASVAMGFSREFSAQRAAAALKARVQTRVEVLRDGRAAEIPLEEVVPGDVVRLSAGSIVPADGVLLQATDFHISEAALTGESYPVLKRLEPSTKEAPLAKRQNCVFMGTNVRSGTASYVVVRTGGATQFGAIAARLTLRPPMTEFDRGLLRFGYLLTSVMVVMMVSVFLVHLVRGRPTIETLLFSIALAVGLSPELLPAILSVNLGRSAKQMAEHGVLVRHLNAIENLGSMDVLCTDKTGTLTEGVVRLEGAYGPTGEPSVQALQLAVENAALETGLKNPFDDAILEACPARSASEKLAEIPFDFTRKRVSVVVRRDQGASLISKGAFHHVLQVCTRLDDDTPLDDQKRALLEERYQDWTARGIRVLAVATRRLELLDSYSRNDEAGLTFNGFLTFLDQPKAGVAKALGDLSKLGVTVKLISGDSKLVAQHVAGLVGMRAERVLTGAELEGLHDEALWQIAERTDLFVEVDPNQKERIIRALKKVGHVVGFLGDGVNDAPAMHAADTSLSVDDAVDVARETADFVLLERDLDVIRRGIQEGRKTFANTLKYVLMTMSANLGNMISMAVASLWLPFLPLLAGQILLNNFLSDIPALGLAADGVDDELVSRPRRWDMRFIGRFMLEFGLISSIFDFLTFGTLLWLAVSPAVFRSGWFVESLLTEILVALLIRTRRPFYRSRPGTFVLVSTALVALLAIAVPFMPWATSLGFAPFSPKTLGALLAITVLYAAAVELNKARFYRRQKEPVTLKQLPSQGATDTVTSVLLRE
ncbi:MAG TPA: magnesium-translocating P-type ATPase [Polyangiaceae bacterium]|nr:magnesium-translocating P-type ATPase [Polyangiaceae bacterium]